MPRVVAIVPVAIERPDRDSTALAVASSAAHLALPHYQSMLRSGGLNIAGDSRSDARELVKHKAFLYGDVDTIVDGIRAYHDAGVDEVVLNPTGISSLYGPEVAIRELGTILRAASRLDKVEVTVS